jgi:myosin heavy subunit
MSGCLFFAAADCSSQHIFTQELSEYAAEGISSSTIMFKDNQATLDLFLRKLGLFALLDEETRFPKGMVCVASEPITHGLQAPTRALLKR